MSEKVFKLYACCIPVKGATRSTINDLQNFKFDFIPNALFEILTLHKDKPVSDIKQYYDHANDGTIDDYFDFLIKKNFGFWCDPDELHLFPDINLDWHRPEEITNAIIDVSLSSTHNYLKIAEELDALNCKAIQLRFFDEKDIEEVDEILEHFDSGVLRHIDLLIKYSENIPVKRYENLCWEHQRVFSVVIHSSPKESFSNLRGLNSYIEHRTESINSSSHCGLVKPSYFVASLDLFSESQQHNSCLNRKISIDIDGSIKNCPSLKTNYGNIQNTSLRSALSHPDFKSLWTIHKDQILVCQDCEFRHICTDCRAYIENPANILSKPLKCNYDPYTATFTSELV